MALTPKQEAFAQAYVETSNASEAYRRSYNAENMKPDSIHVNASKLLADAKVSLRVEELREELRQKHRVTVDDILRELEEARTMAMTGERPQTAAMVAATMGKAKVLGLITDKAEVSGVNGQPVQHEMTVKFVRPK
jgi:phage terminase small subunit